MGALRLHPARVAGLSPRAVSRAWSVFDIQLAIYALALVVIGLLMAFTNSGDAPLATGSVFTRALMWMAIAIIVFTGLYPKPLLDRIEPAVQSLIAHVENRTDYEEPVPPTPQVEAEGGEEEGE